MISKSTTYLHLWNKLVKSKVHLDKIHSWIFSHLLWYVQLKQSLKTFRVFIKVLLLFVVIFTKALIYFLDCIQIYGDIKQPLYAMLSLNWQIVVVHAVFDLNCGSKVTGLSFVKWCSFPDLYVYDFCNFHFGRKYTVFKW